MQITVWDSKKQKNITAGIYNNQTRIFEKRCKSNHYMVLEKGYGIQEEAIKVLIALKCETITLILKNMTFTYPFEMLLTKPVKNYGHGGQRFVCPKR